VNILKQKTGELYSHIIFYPKDFAAKVLIYKVSLGLPRIGSIILHCGVRYLSTFLHHIETFSSTLAFILILYFPILKNAQINCIFLQDYQIP